MLCILDVLVVVRLSYGWIDGSFLGLIRVMAPRPPPPPSKNQDVPNVVRMMESFMAAMQQ